MYDEKTCEGGKSRERGELGFGIRALVGGLSDLLVGVRVRSSVAKGA